MNYEEKYLQALARAEDIYSRERTLYYREVLELLFPELKESEDEKTRTRLVEFFTDWGKTRSHCWNISVKDILAWLEKQKPQEQGSKQLNADEVIEWPGTNLPDTWQSAIKQGIIKHFKKDFEI